jgi:very-short-patch-repair endonuclease
MVGVKFRRQRPVGRYVVDFVCLEEMLVIEVDGGQHGTNRVYDGGRDEWLKSEGYRVLRFWDNEVFENLEGVLEVIRRTIRPLPGWERENKEEDR